MNHKHPHVLVIGRNGQVGWELVRTLAPLARVTAVDYPEIDLCSADSIRSLVRSTRPSVIANAAAYTAVDKAECDEERALAINGQAPGILAEEARIMGAWMLHYSTDYIFDGTKGAPYSETDQPNPLGAYGRSKLAGDQAVQAATAAHLIFRLCWVYGARGQNFMLTMHRLARERDTLKVVADQTGCPTWSRMIAEATAQAVRQVLGEADVERYAGVYNLAAAGSTTWQGFAQAIVDLLPAEEKKCATVQPITTADYPTAAKRPAYSVLDCAKLFVTFGLRLPEWVESLRRVVEK